MYVNDDGLLSNIIVPVYSGEPIPYSQHLQSNVATTTHEKLYNGSNAEIRRELINYVKTRRKSRRK